MAVADTQGEINKHWEKLENELLPTAEQIEDQETLVQFFCAKSMLLPSSTCYCLRCSCSFLILSPCFYSVGGWAALEEGDEGNNVKKVAHFHAIFDALVPDEKLLTCT